MRVSVSVVVVSVVVVCVSTCDEEIIGSGVVTVVVSSVMIVVSAVVSTIGVSVTATVLSLTATVLRSGTAFTFVLVPTAEALPDPGAALLAHS